MQEPSLQIEKVGLGEFGIVADLARRIWPVCFADLISPAQCDYMLRQRYSHQGLSQAIASGTLYELMRAGSEPVGFGAHGPGESPGEWKLGQVYVLPECQGRGLGRLYIEHVAQAALERGCTSLILTVNKGNSRARTLYERCGFRIRNAARFDIGNGFVMDDYVMVLSLDSAELAPKRTV